METFKNVIARPERAAAISYLIAGKSHCHIRDCFALLAMTILYLLTSLNPSKPKDIADFFAEPDSKTLGAGFELHPGQIVCGWLSG